MSEQYETPKEPTFEEVQEKLIEAEEGFSRILQHPVFSLIDPVERLRIEELLNNIKLVDSDELLEIVYPKVYKNLKPKQKEAKLKELNAKDFVHLPGINGQPSRLVANYAFYKNLPKELTYIFQEMAKYISAEMGFKGDLIELNRYRHIDSIEKSDLPAFSKHPIEVKIQGMYEQGKDLKNFWLRELGFSLAIVDKKSGNTEIAFDFKLEDIRINLIRTIMEGIMYSEMTTEGGDFNRIINGFNHIEKTFMSSEYDAGIYIKEHLSIEFLTAYLLNTEISTKGGETNVVMYSPEHDEELLSKLALLVKQLTTLRSDEFINKLSEYDMHYSAFNQILGSFIKYIWKYY
jgi:hypothetical protein